jgi:protein-S-isoprenylcysteine O-methyltransferase Ste14
MQMGTLTVRLVLIVAATAAWLGLAVLGWGGLAAFFSHDALIALTGVTCTIVVASVFAGGNLSSGQREDRDNRWVLAAFTLIGLLDGYLPAWADRNDFWIIGGDDIRWLGVVVFAVGGVLRLWPVYVLGDRFSGLVAIQPGHTLVTNGVYRFIRNPSYLGVIVFSLGWALAFRTGVGLVLTALFLPPLVARMDAEEALLATWFGDEYEAYRARTSRLIPWVY